MEQLIVWQNGQIHDNCSLERLHNARQDPQAVIWLDLHPTAEAFKYESLLTNEFQLTPLTIETIQETKERAKLVKQHNYYYLVVHGMTFDSSELTSTTPKLDLILGPNFLITVHSEYMGWLSDFFQETGNDTEGTSMKQGMGHLLYTVLDHLVDSYFPLLDDLDDVIDELEDAAVEKATNEVQSRIFRLKRALASMRRVISPQVELWNAIVIRANDIIDDDLKPYFSDLHDHMVRTYEILDGYRDLLSGLLDVYLSTISNRQNEIMKQLAIISSIFLPITFITGVFGQNFGHPPQVEHDAGFNFWIVLGVMVIISCLQLWYFHTRKWI